MPLLQVRDCPEDIYNRIAKEAKKERRTIAQEILTLLEKGLGQEQSNIERRRKILEKINARDIPNRVKEIDPVVLIREDRDR